VKKARELLGEQLRQWREAAGLSILQLAEKMGTKRTFIYDIEAGRKNFTVDYWEKLLRACGVPPEEGLRGFSTSDMPREFQDLFRMLAIIVTKGNDDLIHGIRVNLDAISDKALRLHRPRSPSPSPGAAGEEGSRRPVSRGKKSA